MERPGIVWVFTILVALGIVFEFTGIMAIMSGAANIPLTGMVYVMMTIEFIFMILSGVMIYYFFNLKKEAKLWTHIVYGGSLAYTGVYYAISMGSPLIPPLSIFGIVLSVILWWAIVDYVSKKKVDGQLVFN